MDHSMREILGILIRRYFMFLFVAGTLSVSTSALSPDGNSLYFIRDLTGQYRGEHNHGTHQHHESHATAGATSSSGDTQPSGSATAAANSAAGAPTVFTAPPYVDTFAHILPCVPIEACGRYYGQDPTDVATFGTIGPCLQLGSVRCINYGPAAALAGYHYIGSVPLPSAGAASASAQSTSGYPTTFVGSAVLNHFEHPPAGVLLAPSPLLVDAGTGLGAVSANAAAQAQSFASAQANSQANSVEVAGAQSSIFEPHCLCVVRGGCSGRELLTLATRDKSHLSCGGDYELCCFEDPWPGVVDTFAHVLPCAPIEACGRYYGQEATDVAQYGVLGPCPGLGTVRCINPGFALHANSLGHQSVVQTVEIEVPKVQVAAQVEAGPVLPSTTYAAPQPTVYHHYVPAPAPVVPAVAVSAAELTVRPPVIAHPVPAAVAPIAPVPAAVAPIATVPAAVAPVPAIPVAPVPAVPLLTNPGPPYLWNSLGGYRGGYSFLWPNFNVRKHFSFGVLG